MSLPSNQAAITFLSPLAKKFTIFLVDQRTTNLYLGGFLLRCACATNTTASILDIDAFYASSVREVAEKLARNCLGETTLHIPNVRTNVEKWLIRQFLSKNGDKLFLIDDLNTVYHLFSIDDPESANRRLTLAISFLSFLSRLNNFSVMSILYRDNVPAERSLLRARSLARAGDVTASVTVQNGQIRFKNIRGSAWNNREFSAAL
jgi:hypothetical protein